MFMTSNGRGRGRGRGRAKQEVQSLDNSPLPPVSTSIYSPKPIKIEKDEKAKYEFKCPSIYKHIFEYSEEELQGEDNCDSEDEDKIYQPRSRFKTVPQYHSDMKQMCEDISEGMELLCVTGAFSNPSEMYLVLEKDWPKALDKIVANVSKFYNDVISMSQGYVYFPEQANVRPDLLVAAYIKSDKEWFRGRILSLRDDTGDKILYKVQLVDTGETHNVKGKNIFYLDPYYMDEPQLAIKCRLYLDPKYEKYYTGKVGWPKKVGKKMLKALFDKRFYAKFVRSVEHKGEKVWEVSIERFDNESQNPDAIYKIITEAVDLE